MQDNTQQTKPGTRSVYICKYIRSPDFDIICYSKSFSGLLLVLRVMLLSLDWWYDHIVQIYLFNSVSD